MERSQQGGELVIHKINNGFAISSGNVWLPGCYDSERAAKYAFRFLDEELQQLQNKVNTREPDVSKRMISFEMLQELARKRKSEAPRALPSPRLALPDPEYVEARLDQLRRPFFHGEEEECDECP